jgi:hypothetical protein
MGIRVPTDLVDGEEEAVRYLKMTKCEGYCKDLLLRKVAILCAFDNVKCQGKSGSKLFPEFNAKGLVVAPSMLNGRGIAIAENIRKPVATNLIIACCCVNFAIFLMEHRKKAQNLFTDE